MLQEYAHVHTNGVERAVVVSALHGDLLVEQLAGFECSEFPIEVDSVGNVLGIVDFGVAPVFLVLAD